MWREVVHRLRHIALVLCLGIVIVPVSPPGGTEPPPFRDSVVLPRRTLVKLVVLDREAASLRHGAEVPLQVADAVIVDGLEVIPKGNFGVGKYEIDGTERGLRAVRVQLADGSFAELRSLLYRPTNGSFPFSVGSYTVSDATLRVGWGGIQGSPLAKDPPVEAYSCIGARLKEATMDLGEASLFLDIFLKAAGSSEGIPTWVEVAEVKPGSAAERAGLLVGETVNQIRVGTQTFDIKSLADAEAALAKTQPGDTIAIGTGSNWKRVTVDTCYRVR